MAMLNTDYAMGESNKKNTSFVNQKVFDYIHSTGNQSFDELMENEDCVQVFLQLSELRTGLISWYPFESSSHVLEIGAGFGALTGRLCESCEKVIATERSLFRAKGLFERYKDKDNLEIMVGDLFDIHFDEKFDYVIITGLLELMGNGQANLQTYIEYLKEIKQLR